MVPGDNWSDEPDRTSRAILNTSSTRIRPLLKWR